jgi:hypothetical protein
VNAHALGRQFSLEDLLRVASVDPDLCSAANCGVSVDPQRW